MTYLIRDHGRLLTSLTLASSLAFAGGCGKDSSNAAAGNGRVVSRDASSSAIKLSQVNVGVGLPILDVQVSTLYDILPPATTSTAGLQTYASDLSISGSYALTAFNTVGSPQAGAADVIDLSLLELGIPTIKSSQSFTDFDVNSIRLVGSDVWLAGALQDVGAWFRVYPLASGVLGTKRIEGALPSYAGTGISAAASGSIYVSSGDGNGKISAVDTTTGAITAVASVPDARAVARMSNGDAVVLSGTPGVLARYTSTGSPVWTAAIGGATIAQSKSTLAVGSTYIAATMGDGGTALVCAADGKIMTTIPPAVAGTVTNAVANGPGVIITADGDGAASIYLLESSATGPTSSCAKVQLSSIGRVTFADGISANNVTTGSFGLSLGLLGIKVYTGRLYIAAGINGFRTVSLVYTAASTTLILSL